MEEKYNLWNPMVDYSMSDKDEIMEKTSSRLDKLLNIYNDLADALANYSTIINSLLKKKNTIEEISRLVKEPDFELCCQIDHEFNLFYVFAKIAALEKNYLNHIILDKANDMTSLCNYGQKIIFGLRRLEFNWEEETVAPFIEWLFEERISYVVLAELVLQRLFVNKKLICKRLYQFYHIKGYKMEAAKLFFILAKRHGEETLYVELAQVLLEEGEIRIAYELLMDWEHKSVDVDEITQSLKKRLVQYE